MTEIVKVRGHYEVLIDGEFYCTCDTHEEALEEVQYIENKEVVL